MALPRCLVLLMGSGGQMRGCEGGRRSLGYDCWELLSNK